VQLIEVTSLAAIERGREIQRRLRDAGFDAYWESVRTDQGDVVRVRVAVDRAKQSVAATLAELKRQGFAPVLVDP
jgi:cell division septation protein DedD